jgi:hypothetical protein
MPSGGIELHSRMIPERLLLSVEQRPSVDLDQQRRARRHCRQHNTLLQAAR